MDADFAVVADQFVHGDTMSQYRYVTRLMSALFTLQRRQILCDVTLTADDGQLSAHSAVLAAASQYICTQFTGSRYTLTLQLLLNLF